MPLEEFEEIFELREVDGDSLEVLDGTDGPDFLDCAEIHGEVKGVFDNIYLYNLIVFNEVSMTFNSLLRDGDSLANWVFENYKWPEEN